MKKVTRVLTALFFAMTLAMTGFAMPANAMSTIAEEDRGPAGTPWSYVDYAGTPSMDDLQAAAAQYQARDGYSMVGATGMNVYEVLNLNIPVAGTAADLATGVCNGPILYTDIPDRVKYVAELGECGGWDRYGWLQEGNVVRLNGLLGGDYMVADVLALGAPGNEKLGYSTQPDVVLMVNNEDALNQMYVFGLVDYTKRTNNVPVA